MFNPKALTWAVVMGLLIPLVPMNVLYESPILAQTQNERKTEANRLFERGLQQSNTNQFQEALQSWQKALEIYQEIGDRYGEASSLNGLGKTYSDLGQYQQAIDFHQKALVLFRELDDSEAPTKKAIKGEGLSLGSLGSAYLSLGQYRQAIAFYQQALAVQQKIEVPTPEDRYYKANLLSSLAIAHHNLEEYQQAIKLHQQALVIWREIDDRSEEFTSLNHLCVAYNNIGQLQKARECYQEVSELPNPDEGGTFFIERGHASLRQGQYQQAIELFQQALALARELENRQEEATSLSGLGDTYESLGEYEQAIKFHQQALAIQQEINNPRGQAVSLSGLGNSYHRLEKYQEALEFHQQALAIQREIDNQGGEAKSLGDLGNVYFRLEEYQQAIEFHQQALGIQQKIGDQNGAANSLGNLATIYHALEEDDKVIEYLQQSLAILQEIGDPSSEAIVLDNIGFIYMLQNQPELAITFLKQSVNLTESIRQDNRGLSTRLQQSYLQTVEDKYRRLADLLLYQKRITEAQQVLELLKVQELKDFTRNTEIRESKEGIILNDFEQKIIDEYGTLIAFGAEINQCEKHQCDTEKIKQLKDQRRQFVEQFNEKINEQMDVIRENRKNDENFYDPSSLGETARKIIEAQPGTVLVYPLVLKNKLWILWTTKGDVAGIKEVRVTQEHLGETVMEFRKLLDDPNSDIYELQTTAQKLYRWIIEPIESELTENQIQRLVFAQDRVTRYIPMAALHDGEQYLIQRYTIHSILSANLTDMNDKLEPGIENNSILALGLSDAVPGFNSLPNVETELDGIVRSEENDSEGVYKGQKFLNQAFNFDALMYNVSQHRILHIATHGKFEAGSPENSFLVLGTGERLTIPKIDSIGSELEDVHLVVLSACETALGGPDAEGIEIAGMSSYFLKYPRASAVMASLWLVNDPATSRLMRQFYHYLAEGKTKAEALQQTQLDFLNHTQTVTENDERTGDGGFIQRDIETGLPVNVSNNLSHPYYWAAFILIGNGL